MGQLGKHHGCLDLTPNPKRGTRNEEQGRSTGDGAQMGSAQTEPIMHKEKEKREQKRYQREGKCQAVVEHP